MKAIYVLVVIQATGLLAAPAFSKTLGSRYAGRAIGDNIGDAADKPEGAVDSLDRKTGGDKLGEYISAASKAEGPVIDGAYKVGRVADKATEAAGGDVSNAKNAVGNVKDAVSGDRDGFDEFIDTDDITIQEPTY